VDPTDDEAVADGIDRILGDRDLCARLLAEGRERIDTFKWEKTAELHKVAYREALATQR
jgi:hypothetical protein